MVAQKIEEIKSKIGKYDKDFLLGLYERMLLIRQFEEQVKFLFLEGVMPGTIHQCQGQEATAVGVCSALNTDDYITSTHRPHGHALAKGLSPEEMLIELFGGGNGCCKGKGGSMHVGNMEKGMAPAIAIVGGGIPLATGIALAFKMQKSKQVAACFFGDGASSEGAFHEGVNLAAVWNLPIVYVCENNLYGASTRIEKVTRLDSVAGKAAAYGIRGETVWGNDVLAVYEKAQEAVEKARNGKGPSLIEATTYRWYGHGASDNRSYRTREEEELWKKKCPIKKFKKMLLDKKIVTESEITQMEDAVTTEVAEAVDFAEKSVLPNPEEVMNYIFS